MEDKNLEFRINFLSNAIQDTQELIRFIDSKTAVAITILGSYIVGLFLAIDNVFLNWKYHSFLFAILLITLISFIIVCVLVIKRIIRPTNNPTENIKLGGENIPDTAFFIAPNSNSFWFPFFNSTKNKLKMTYSNYLSQINNADASLIIKSLSFELLKVSFIRNIKNDRFNFLVKCLITSTILFVCTYLFYVVETQNAREIMEIKSKYKEHNEKLHARTAEMIKSHGIKRGS